MIAGRNIKLEVILNIQGRNSCISLRLIIRSLDSYYESATHCNLEVKLLASGVCVEIIVLN